MITDAHGKIRFRSFKQLMPTLGQKYPKRFKLGLVEPWESECSSDGMQEKLHYHTKSCHLLSHLLKNYIVELHKGMQGMKLNNNNVTNELAAHSSIVKL